jgi:hypothetical protein
MNCLSVRRSKAALVGGVAASRMASTPIVDANVPETSLPTRAVNLWNDCTIHGCPSQIASIPLAAVAIEVDHATVRASFLVIPQRCINLATFCCRQSPCCTRIEFLHVQLWVLLARNIM